MNNNMNNRTIDRTFVFSCPTFGGFKRKININLCETKQDVIDRMICLLEQKIKKEDLYRLIEILNTNKKLYHIHDYEFGYILLNDQEYYICNHGCL
tara:strand:+ start:212 stop:499 length:288 start_codon:yes stop_codon:yes gene_type:complete